MAFVVKRRSVRRFAVEAQYPLHRDCHVYGESFPPRRGIETLLEVNDAPALRGFNHEILALASKAVLGKHRAKIFQKTLKEEIRWGHSNFTTRTETP